MVLSIASALLIASSPVRSIKNEDPVDLIEDANFASPLPASWRVNVAHAHIVSGQSKKFSKALHLEFEATVSHEPSDVSLSAKSVALVHLTDTVAVRLWMRGDPKAGASDVKVRVRFRQTGELEKTLIDSTVKLTSGWKEYRFAAASTSQILPGEGEMSLSFGYGPGIVDISQLRVQDLGDAGPDSVHPTSPQTSKGASASL